MESHDEDNGHSAPNYFLLIVGALSIVFFGTGVMVLVRLWKYKGALSPQPDSYVYLPFHLRHRAGHLESPTYERLQKPRSVFAYFSRRAFQTGSGDSGPAVPLSNIPRINISAINIDNEPDAEVRAFVAEQQRISRLPTFDQDDCGDGSQFPDVPFADTSNAVQSSPVYGEPTRDLGLAEKAFNEWLAVDTTHSLQHDARESLLYKRQADCVQVTREGEGLSKELLLEVATFLTEAHPEQFTIKSFWGQKNLRDELRKEEFALSRPYDFHPLETCARLVDEDFYIFSKGEFTQQYYLQASASLAPAGVFIDDILGKSLRQIRDNDVYQWDDLSDILHLPLLAPMTRSTVYVQTQPDTRPLSSLLFVQHNKDFFPGTMAALHPPHFLVRYEKQTFRRMQSGAVVFSTRTELKPLMDLTLAEHQALVAEIEGWSELVARWRGKALWASTVLPYCKAMISSMQ